MAVETQLPGAPPSTLLRVGWLIAAIAATLLVAVHLRSPVGVVGDSSYMLVTAGAAYVAWLGARRQPRGSYQRRAAYLLTLGVASSALADVIFIALTWLNSETPDLSLADVFYLASYGGVIGAMVMFSKRPDARRWFDVDSVVDMAVMLVVGLLIMWEAAIAPALTDSSVSLFARLVLVSYPVLDSVLLALVIRALASRRRGALGVPAAVGVICWLVSDFAYATMSDPDAIIGWLDAGWMAGAALLAVAAWPQREVPRRGRPGGGTSHVGRASLSVVLLPLIVPGGVEVAGNLQGADPNPIPLFTATVLLLALGLVRVNYLVRLEDEARAELGSRERLFRALAANSADAVVVTGGDGRIIMESPSFAAFVGHREGSLLGVHPSQLLAPVVADEAEALFLRARATSGEVITAELEVRTLDDAERWLSLRMVNLLDDPDVGGVVINMHDITGRKQAEDELQHQAFHDGLTGLANRALFRNRVEHGLRRASRTALDPAVIYFDLDGFKTVNDSLGHEAGDELLRQVAQRLTATVRSGDTVGRLGADEFGILIERAHGTVDEAAIVARRILESLSRPISVGGCQLTFTASLGVVVADGSSTVTSMLRNADIAMYQAKTKGKACWVLFDEAMSAAAVERLQLENDMIHALDAGEFRLVYQPVVRLEDGGIVGFEALLRWEHPTLGMVPPDRFIPIAEENGLIVPIGRWVLDEACRTAVRWQERFPQAPPLHMAVNLSARQLASEELVASVADALGRSRLDPGSLVLELTETVLVKDSSLVADRLRQLRALGVRLAIDDFGTGYSSLSYLRQFPMDILKIDRSFVNMITDRDEVPAIVRGLLDLGRTLQLETVAEGVESEVQRDRLRHEQCSLAQGYLFARPLAAAGIEEMLDAAWAADGESGLG